MKEYIKPMTNIEEAVMVSMIADSINLIVSDDDADKGINVLIKDEEVYGDLW